MPGLLIVVFIALAIGGAIISHQMARKRREAFQALARRLGLSFTRKDYSIDEEFHFLDALRRGSNRYGYNILRGEYQGHRVAAFDYHYETHSSGSKGRRRTNHHHFSFFIIRHDRSFPELKIGPEGFFSKIGQMIGFQDIDFESVEFSDAFCVRSRDKRFAYDVCHTRMMEYLLRHRGLTIEFDRDCIAMRSSRRIAPDAVEPRLRQLIEIRDLLPAYLFSDGAGEAS